MNYILPYPFRFELCYVPKWFCDGSQQQVHVLSVTGIKGAQGKEKLYVICCRYSHILPGH